MNTHFGSNGSIYRLGALAIAILVFATVLSACTPISTSATASAAENTEYHLELFDTEVDGVTTPVDLLTADDFPGLGDIILESHQVRDVATQEVVGNSITRVHIISADAEGDMEFLIDCTIVLADGTFHFTGGGKFSGLMGDSGVDVPVVGGTGAYTYGVGTVNLKFGMLGEIEGANITADISVAR